MFRVIPAAVLLVLIAAAPASAATQAAAGPSPTPLILEFALAALVFAVLALRGAAGRGVAAMRRRRSGSRRATRRASERAPVA